MERYGRNAGLAGSAGLAAITWILQAAGGLLYIGASPFFYYSLIGLRMPRWSLALYLAVDALALAAVIVIDEETGAVFGSLAAQLRKTGRQTSYRVQDVWIASQAVQHGHRLLTRNPGDFEDIPGLDLVVFGAKPPKG